MTTEITNATETTETTETTVNKLIKVISKALQQTKNTGIMNHLWGIFHQTNKGKAIIFTWQKERFRLTANYKIQQYDFTNSLVESTEAKRIEQLIKAVIS